MNRPLCFVLMPFGKKIDAAGVTIDFDNIYRELIAQAITDAGMDPIRADEEMNDGIIHKAMFERLLMCEYAVGDLTTANANVFYELGIRHAARPWSTVLIFAENLRLPFDVAPLRALPYPLSASGTVDKLEETRSKLVERLRDANRKVITAGSMIDSPLFQLIGGLPSLVDSLDPDKLESFRNRMQEAAGLQERLAGVRDQKDVDSNKAILLKAIERDLSPIANQEPRVILDLFQSYRSVRAWPEMIALAEQMPPSLHASVTVQEQLALALNRAGQGAQAEKVLQELLEKRGPSSETYGLLGRIYKDRWRAAVRANQKLLARGLLDKAIDAYVRGFETDWRDAYPGINACTLLEVRGPSDPQFARMLPVVTYAVERKIAAGKPAYWDYATLVELAVLAKDEARANAELAKALASPHEGWQPESTAGNLRLIRESREQRGEVLPWVQQIEDELNNAAKG